MFSDRGTEKIGGVAGARGARATLVALALALAAGLLVSGSAQAARNVLGRTFGTAGSGAGQMLLRASVNGGPANAERFAGSGVAVDAATGDLYVADTGNHRVDEFAADGAFVRAWGWGVGGGSGFETCTITCQAGLSGSSPGEFEEPVFIAIDETPGGDGDVYVGDQGDQTITKFTAEGVLVSSWGSGGQLTGSPTGASGALVSFKRIDGIAVSSTGLLDVIERQHPEESKSALFQFQASGAFVEQLTVAHGAYPAGLAIGAVGELFMVSSNQRVEKLSGAGVEVGLVKKTREQFHEVQSSGLAANGFSPDTLYVDGEQKEIEVYEFNVAGEVEEPGQAPCPVRPKEVISGVVEEFGCAPTESFGAGELSESAGLAVDGASGNLFVADTGHDRIVEYLPRIPAAPLVVGGWATDVTETSASLFGEVDPEGVATEYFLEVGACGSPGTCSEAGYERVAGSAGTVGAINYHPQRVGPVVLEGLAPGVTYHYRFAARNGDGGPAYGAQRVFATRGTGSFELPDGREYELVSPPNKDGSLIEPILEEGLVQAAANGDAMTYLAISPTEPEPQGYQFYEQVLSTRGPDGGWSSQDIEPPHAEVAGLSVGEGQEYQFFSEDLSHAIVDPLGTFDQAFGEAASPPASEQTPFMRSDFAGAEASGGQCTSSCYGALVTGAAGYTNVPAGTVFGGQEAGKQPCRAGVRCGPIFIDASTDAQHVVLQSGVALTPALAPKGGLYEWSARMPASEQLRLVSQLPPGQGGGPALGALLGWNDMIVRDAVSTDGERVVWENQGNLYVRVHATRVASPTSEGKCTVAEDACTIQLDHGLTGSPAFQAASSDGERVFFTEAGNLYVYVVGTGERDAIAEGAEVAGPMIQGVSEDGSWVYFAANGVLGDAAERGATHGDCGNAAGTCNLYVWHEGVTRLVAVLSGADTGDWSGLAEDEVTARVAPDGEWLAFMSRRSLTGYDNADAVTGEPDEEVFEYDAQHERVVCASCNPTGSRPTGVKYTQIEIDSGGLAGGKNVWPASTGIAANVPGMTPFRLQTALYQSRYLSDSGRLFFNSADALVPKDSDGVEDVYEFEPAGVGTCTSATSTGSVVFVADSGGCVGLISSGTSTRESAFLDASADGSSVFFLTVSKLVPQDYDTALDVYDARECPVASACFAETVTVPPACTSEASCKAAPSPQPEVYGPSGSATFSGPGDDLAPPPIAAAPLAPPKPPLTAAQLRARELAAALRRCARDRSPKKRAACVRAAHARYGPKGAKQPVKARTRRRG